MSSRRNRIEEHLRALRSSAAATLLAEAADIPEELLGLPTLAAHPTRGLLVGGFPIPCSTRRCSDLVRASASGVHVRDADHLRSLLGAGFDPVLYEAYRCILPSRTSRCGASGTEGAGCPPGLLTWRADLVRYRSGALPTGELHRSVGHWNPLDEWEIFEVLEGRVVMIFARRSKTGRWVADVVECGQGTGAVAAPGAWHITYVVSGDPMVLNIYSAAGEDRPPPELEMSKYERRSGGSPRLHIVVDGDRVGLPAWPAPEPCTLRLEVDTEDAVDSTWNTAQGPLVRSRPQSLGSWFATATDEMFEAELSSMTSRASAWPRGGDVPGAAG